MANWYSTDWWHRVPILLKADKAGGATHADFPVLLGSSMPAHFWSKVRADGLDCVLTQADGVTPLFREVATFDVGTEKPEIHFRLPSYSHLADTVVYLYYKNPDAPVANSPLVWDSSFAAVYHMNDDPADSTKILDSTANGNTGTKGGAYASNAADLSNGTGTLASNPTEIAAGTSGTEVVVTSAGTFTITIPANQLLIVTKGTVTSVAINNPTAGNRTITVVGTGTFTATWAVTAAPTEVAGTIGRAQQFVAESQQYIQLATSPLAGCTQATVMAVVRKDSWVKFQSAAASYTAGNKGWILGYENPAGTIKAYVGDGTATAIAEQTGFPSAEWASMAFRYVASDASGITAFVNGSGGTPIDTTTVAQLDPTPPAAYIGRYYIRYSNYTIDECRLSSVARSAEWIASEYNWLLNNALCYEVGDYENRPLYIMQGYRRVKDAATFDAQAYRRLTLPAGYIAQAYRRLTLPAGYIAQAYRRLADRALYTLATKRRLRPLYRVAERIRYGLDHREKPYGLDHREKPYGLD